MNSIEDYARLLKRSKALIISTLLFVIVIIAYFTLTRAWFASSKSIDANGINLSVKSFEPKTFTLYRLDKDDSGDITIDDETYGWVLMNGSIDFSSYVPNEVHRYKIVCDSSEITRLAFGINSVDSVIAGADDNDTKFSYFDFLYFRPTTQVESLTDSTLIGTTPTFNTQANTSGMGVVNDSVISSVIYYAELNSSNEIIFDLYIHKDMSNMYSGWHFTGTISIE